MSEDAVAIENQTPQEANLLGQFHLAEKIAFFKEDLLTEFNSGLLVEHWRQVYEKFLNEQPAEVKKYDIFFRTAVNTAVEERKDLDAFWVEHIKNPIKDGPIEYVEGEEAGSLFELFYGFKPDNAIATRGIFNLRFFINDRDLSKAYPKNENVGAITETTKAPFSIVLVDITNKSYLYANAHEQEHVEENIRIASGFNLPYFPYGVSEFDKVFERSISLPDALSSEILAYFAEIVNEKSSLLDKDPSSVEFFRKGFHKRLLKYRDFVKIHLINNSGDGGNYEGIDRQKVKSAVDAVIDLISLYESEWPEINTPRLALDVLSQFKVEHWSAVVRLLKREHEEKKSQK
jgi:hypothetical protein